MDILNVQNLKEFEKEIYVNIIVIINQPPEIKIAFFRVRTVRKNKGKVKESKGESKGKERARKDKKGKKKESKGKVKQSKAKAKEKKGKVKESKGKVKQSKAKAMEKRGKERKIKEWKTETRNKSENMWKPRLFRGPFFIYIDVFERRGVEGGLIITMSTLITNNSQIAIITTNPGMVDWKTDPTVQTNQFSPRRLSAVPKAPGALLHSGAWHCWFSVKAVCFFYFYFLSFFLVNSKQLLPHKKRSAWMMKPISLIREQQSINQQVQRPPCIIETHPHLC